MTEKAFKANTKWSDKNGLAAKVMIIGDEKILHDIRENKDYVIVESDPYRIQVMPKIGDEPLETWLKKPNGVYIILDVDGNYKGKSIPV